MSMLILKQTYEICIIISFDREKKSERVYVCGQSHIARKLVGLEVLLFD